MRKPNKDDFLPLKTQKRKAPEEGSLGDIYLKIIRSENPKTKLSESAETLGISASSQNHILYGHVDQEWLAKHRIPALLIKNFPAGWTAHHQEFLSKVFELKPGQKIKDKPPSAADHWKAACGDLAKLTENWRKQAGKNIKSEIGQGHVQKSWDRVVAADSEVTIATYEKTLREIFKVCENRSYVIGAQQIGQMAETLLNLAPKMV